MDFSARACGWGDMGKSDRCMHCVHCILSIGPFAMALEVDDRCSGCRGNSVG